jgi:galactonate dehydratase
MRITKLEARVVQVNVRGDWVFVLLHTDAGISGLGEASHSANDALTLAALEQMGLQLQGQDPWHIARLWQSLNRSDAGRAWQTALSAIEQALWDILGRSLRVPVRALFGGALRERIRLYANINRHVRERSPQGFARAAQQATQQGFRAIKLAPFDELQQPDHVRSGPQAAWRTGVERVRAVRAAIGDDAELAVDCHGRMETSEALIVAQELADCHLMWYEEAVPYAFVDALARITQAVPMPTASGEYLFTIEGFAPFLTRRVVDVLMPDVKHCGGLRELKSISEAARMQGLLVAPHNPAGPVSTAATAQVASTLSNFLILEYAWGEVDWRTDLMEPAERIEDGYLLLSQEPGLGHTLREETVQRHARVGARSDDTSKVAI